MTKIFDSAKIYSVKIYFYSILCDSIAYLANKKDK